MTTTDWVIDIALVLLVFRQLREQRLTARTILLPVALMSWAGLTYLKSVPTAGNDPVLIALLTAVGVVFGLLSGQLPHGPGPAPMRPPPEPKGSPAGKRMWSASSPGD